MIFLCVGPIGIVARCGSTFLAMLACLDDRWFYGCGLQVVFGSCFVFQFSPGFRDVINFVVMWIAGLLLVFVVYLGNLSVDSRF